MIETVWNFRRVLLLPVILVLAWTAANAQWDITKKVCFPNAVGVPGEPGPPDWWSHGSGAALPATPCTAGTFYLDTDAPAGARYFECDSADSKWKAVAHDPHNQPRWRGATQRTWGNGSQQAAMRGLASTDSDGITYLYIRFVVPFDPTLDTAEDSVVVVLADATTQHRLLVFPIADQNEKVLADPHAVYYATAPVPAAGSPAVWTDQPKPAWLLGGESGRTRVWVKCTGGGVPCTQYEWGVVMRIPVQGKGSLGLGATFGFYTDLLIRNGGGIPQYPFPRPDSAVDTTLYITEAFGVPDYNGIPPIAKWGQGQTAACTDGISLSTSQIGTTNSQPHQINTISANTFFIRPDNATGSTVAANKLVANVRIANWGISPPGPTRWKEITPAAGSANAGAIGTGGAPTQADCTAATPPSRCNAFTFNWSVPIADRPYYTPTSQGGQGNSHQCMLVQMTSPINLDFSNDSAFRNMDFVKASTFERSAEIATHGLGDPPPGSPGHRVWVYVEQRQLPTATWGGRITAGIQAVLPFLRREPRRVAAQPRPPGDSSGATGTPVGGTENPGPPPQTDDEFTKLAETAPTYQVHAYVETGKFVTLAGTRQPVLAPVGSYGYSVSHVGELVGWDTAFGGMEKRGPNLYASVIAKDSVLKVTDRIEAVEPSAIIGIIVLLILLLILYLIFRLIRRATA